eukprot:8863723-Pyramimonas_sp.AAC.1
MQRGSATDARSGRTPTSHTLRENPPAQVPEAHRRSRRGSDLQEARSPGQQAGVIVAGGHLARARREGGRAPDRNVDGGVQ